MVDAWLEVGPSRAEYECAGCGEWAYHRMPSDALEGRYTKRFCSKVCRGRHFNPSPEVMFRVKKCCRVCFTYFTTMGVVCSEACRKTYQATHQRRFTESRHGGAQILCQGCGVQFTSEYGSKARIFCSMPCGARHQKRKRRRQYGSDNHRRRARRYGVPYEPVAKQRVFERDGWRCRLCGGRILRDKACPHPRSPSLDHIVPMARGGGHTYDNVQAAHFLCNSLKGDGSVGSQLLLLG